MSEYAKHDLHVGMRIGRLTLLEYHRGGSAYRSQRLETRAWYTCRCDCGRTVGFDTLQLRRAKYVMCRDCRAAVMRAARHDAQATGVDWSSAVESEYDWIQRQRGFAS